MTYPRRRARGWSRLRIAAFALASLLAPFATFAAVRSIPHGSTAVTADPTPTAAPPPLATATATATTPAPTPTATAVATITPEPEPVPTAAATTVEDKDAPMWRKILRASAATSDWKRGAAAIRALIQLDPAALSEPSLTSAASDVAASLEVTDPADSALTFEALAKAAGGLDVLHQIATQRGGSKAALRATDLLKKPEVRARASAALDIVLSIRDAACPEKEALMARAATEGDHRALALILPLRAPDCDPRSTGCCLRENEKVETTVKQMLARIRPPGSEKPRAKPADGDDPYQ